MMATNILSNKRSIFSTHIDCNWSLVFEVYKDVIEKKKIIITSARHGVTNRITKAISEAKGKLTNIRAAMEGSRLQ